MDLFGIGPLELLVILVVALLVLGPEQLPSMAQKAGKFLQQARSSVTEARDTIVADMSAAVEGTADRKQSGGHVNSGGAHTPVLHQPTEAAPTSATAAAHVEQAQIQPPAGARTDSHEPALRRQTH